MAKILTVGVFDYFHLGHLRLFKQCKEHADYLIVAVQDNDSILRYKPDAKIYYNTDQRVELVSALGIVDEVVIYTDVDKIVKTVDFDILALGQDQNHSGFQNAEKWCMEHNKKVVRLKRTQGICSREIKKEVEDMR